jgi:hypothetical protein
MAKPDTMCTETGCTRDWVVEITEDATGTLSAPAGGTGRKRGLCVPCAEMRRRVRAEEPDRGFTAVA